MESKVEKKNNNEHSSSLSSNSNQKPLYKKSWFWIALAIAIVILIIGSWFLINRKSKNSNNANNSIKVEQKAKKRAKGPFDSVETDKPGVYRNRFGDETSKGNFVIWEIFYNIILNKDKGRRANSKEVASMFGSKPSGSIKINPTSKDKIMAKSWKFKDIMVVVYFKNDIAFKVQSANFRWNSRGHKLDLKAYKSLSDLSDFKKEPTKYTAFIKKYGMPDNLTILASEPDKNHKKEDYSITAYWSTGINGKSKKSEVILWFTNNQLLLKKEKGLK